MNYAIAYLLGAVPIAGCVEVSFAASRRRLRAGKPTRFDRRRAELAASLTWPGLVAICAAVWPVSLAALILNLFNKPGNDLQGRVPPWFRAQIDTDGHLECGDKYCAGYPDCGTCRDLRQAERQRYETTASAPVEDLADRQWWNGEARTKDEDRDAECEAR